MEEELSARGDGYQKGLLRRIRTGDRSNGGQGQEMAQAEGGGSGEIELGLGLSLGGRFGVEPKEKGLVRSCSFSMFPSWRDFPVVAPFARTCSLPPETEEELRKRKELRSLKRLEAKRRRLEKRSPISGITIRKDEVFEEETSGLRNGGLPAWAAGAGRAAAPTVDASKHFRLASRLSTGSQGSSSSTLSDIDNHLKQGLSNSPEVKRPVTGSLLFEQSIYKAVPNDTVAGKQFTCVTEKDDQSRKATRGASENRVPKKLGRVMIEDMPCVSTKVDGPNGRSIEGFLYKYRKGEEVKIMCVCHDSFFTPAEFVKHAGGGDVAHPLRHIVVNALPSTFLR